MYAILCYDVNKKRDARVLKTAKKYLRHVQRSVLEGEISEASLARLKRELEQLMEPEKDSATIYLMRAPALVEKQQLGINTGSFDGFV